ncbi:RTA1 like protein-domain-containing protein [Podospora appendiculata]|uniref:RTA1 like protein-domain-containing protein n=1 Tax=Podospora appendiculata TaxID=314037 RepID=A0AAE0XBU2_9PEZI|nr:RTA1 like protein-domain-containing protein [Podospora appendiculata]
MSTGIALSALMAAATGNGTTPAFKPSYKTCHEISKLCPVEMTTLGYTPNFGVNIFVAAGFAVAAVSSIYFGIAKRTWGYSSAVAFGCILECAGYIGRAQLAKNPWNSTAFQTQIVAIILGPTIICIGLYLTLKHVARALNPSLSLFPPRLYPLFFVPADVSCLVIQAIGGGIAASAGSADFTLLQHGNRVIIAGIVLQVLVLAVFGAIAGLFLVRSRGFFGGAAGREMMPAFGVWKDGRFRLFLGALGGAYVLFLIRCVYRIAEMAGGWGNHIMRDEPSFIVLESFMVLIGSGLLAGFPPGVFFPLMSRSPAIKESANARYGHGGGSSVGGGKADGSDSAGTEMAERAVSA